MVEIAVIVPVIERPWAATPFMESWRKATSGRSKVYTVCQLDDADTWKAWSEEEGVTMIVAKGPRYGTKVNQGYRATREPWLLLVGDDVQFHYGWEDAVLEAGKRGAVVSTNDCHRDDLHQLAVHPAFSRSYIELQGANADGPGGLASSEYFHQYVDQEWSYIARTRGELVYAPDAVIRHNHPVFGAAMDDHIYQLAESHHDEDYQTALRRLVAWEENRCTSP